MELSLMPRSLDNHVDWARLSAAAASDEFTRSISVAGLSSELQLRLRNDLRIKKPTVCYGTRKGDLHPEIFFAFRVDIFPEQSVSSN
jgi:hypothetical protein